MNDKYKLTREQNVFLAKKMLVGNIYCGIKLEGSRLTFPETQTILDGVNVQNATIDDIQAILNMRDAWQYLLKTIDEPMSIEYACKINKYIARNESLEWGVLRDGVVGISGTSYKPEIPVENKVKKELEILLDKDVSDTEKAIKYFLWGSRNQLFWDGNKRTSLICANKILIQSGCGVLVIPDDKIQQFNVLLTDFYETNNYNKISKFIHETSVAGIEFQQETTLDDIIELNSSDNMVDTQKQTDTER